MSTDDDLTVAYFVGLHARDDEIRRLRAALERTAIGHRIRARREALHCKSGDLIDDIEVPPMVICPTCAGHGAIPAPVAERMRREREDPS